MHINPSTSYIFLIHTSEYAGNFERQMCAFITGHIGDCEVGSGYIDAKIGRKFQNYIESRNDDYGCSRPCSIWENGAGEYNTVAIFFSRKPSKALIELMKGRAFAFSKAFEEISGRPNNLSVLGFELLEEVKSYRKLII